MIFKKHYIPNEIFMIRKKRRFYVPLYATLFYPKNERNTKNSASHFQSDIQGSEYTAWESTKVREREREDMPGTTHCSLYLMRPKRPLETPLYTYLTILLCNPSPTLVIFICPLPLFVIFHSATTSTSIRFC